MREASSPRLTLLRVVLEDTIRVWFYVTQKVCRSMTTFATIIFLYYILCTMLIIKSKLKGQSDLSRSLVKIVFFALFLSTRKSI